MLPTVTEVAVPSSHCVVTRGFAAFIKLAGALSSRLFCSYGRGMLFQQHTAIITNLVTGVTRFFNLRNEKRIPNVLSKLGHKLMTHNLCTRSYLKMLTVIHQACPLMNRILASRTQFTSTQSTHVKYVKVFCSDV